MITDKSLKSFLPETVGEKMSAQNTFRDDAEEQQQMKKDKTDKSTNMSTNLIAVHKKSSVFNIFRAKNEKLTLQL
jgi:hypothetical protein